jgi:hypothetical protein
MAPRPMSGTPESLAESLLVEIREDVRMMDSTLRGEGGRNGLVAKVNGLMERVARLEESQRLKIVPAQDAPTIRARAEAWAIRAGAAIAILMALIEAAQRIGGGS